jgi:hypothetical protein
MGPGFLLFFQQEEEPFVGSGIEEISRKRALKRKNDEETIMMVIKAFLDKQ